MIRQANRTAFDIQAGRPQIISVVNRSTIFRLMLHAGQIPARV